jgi:type VI protein secretion system component VasF
MLSDPMVLFACIIIECVGKGSVHNGRKRADHAERLARALDKQETAEPEDIVERVKEAARGHRYLAWAIIGFFVLTAVVTFANQAIQLLQNLGILTKP